MSLATGEEQQVALHFSRSLIWSDFIEGVRFTFMYDGQIHSDVAPVTGGGGVRIDGDDGELLINIPEWSVPSSDVNITLELGHKDWVLLGITYDDRYQLKPQDLEGLSCPKGTDATTSITNAILGGEEVVFNFNEHIIKARLINSNLQYYVMACSPAVSNHFVGYQDGVYAGGNRLINYSCDSFDDIDFGDQLIDWLKYGVGLQNPTEEYMGVMSHVEIPIGSIEN